MVSFLILEKLDNYIHQPSIFRLCLNCKYFAALLYGQFLPKQATKDRTAAVRNTYSHSVDGVMEGMVNTSSKMHKAFEYEGIMHTTKLGPA